MSRFPKDCWDKNCEHFHVMDMSVDDLVCACGVLGYECDACDEDYCHLRCPLAEKAGEGKLMAEYIERETAKAKIREKFKFVPARIEINEVLNSIPAADVRPVRRGKWSRVYDDFMKSNYDTCSCCGKEYFGANGFNFCPNCGADMGEES